MKFRHFAVILSALGLMACEDNGEVGSLIQPSEDVLSISSFMVNVQTESVLADSSLCKSANFILGQYTDPKFGVTQAEFLTQIDGRLGGVFIPDTTVVTKNSTVNGVLNTLLTDFNPKFGNILKITDPSGLSVDSVFFHAEYSDDFIGDSLSLQAIDVYALNRTLPGGVKYYSNTDPALYCDKDELLGSLVYQVAKARRLRVPLSKEYGEKLASIYTSGSGVKKQSEFNDIIKGIYVSHSFNEGGIIKIPVAGIYLYYSYDAKIHTTYDGRDTIVDSRELRGSNGERFNPLTLGVFFSANKAVERADVIKHINLKESFAELESDKGASYTFTPSGINTSVKIPFQTVLDSLSKNGSDTSKVSFNGAYLKLYTKKLDWETKFSKNPNSFMLLVNKDSIDNFFYRNQSPDKINSFSAAYDTSGVYSFDITYAMQRMKNGETSFDLEDMVVVPVSISTVNGSYFYNQENWMTAVCFYGSEAVSEEKRPRIDIVYTERK